MTISRQCSFFPFLSVFHPIHVSHARSFTCLTQKGLASDELDITPVGPIAQKCGVAPMIPTVDQHLLIGDCQPNGPPSGGSQHKLEPNRYCFAFIAVSCLFLSFLLLYQTNVVGIMPRKQSHPQMQLESPRHQQQDQIIILTYD